MNFKNGFAFILSMFFVVVAVGILTMYLDGEVRNLNLAVMIFVIAFLLAPFLFGVTMHNKIKYGWINYFKLLAIWFCLLVS